MEDGKHPSGVGWILILASVILLALAALPLILIRANGGGPLPMEVNVTQAVQALPFLWMPYLMAPVSLWGYMPWSALVVAACGWILARRVSLWTGIYFLAVAAAQGVVNTLLKNALMRPRPSEPLAFVALPAEGYSFPSGHVMFYTICFGLLIYLVLRRGKHTIWRDIGLAVLAALILLVGPSRLYLGAHWLADVIAGYLLGAILLAWAIVGLETPRLKISPD